MRLQARLLISLLAPPGSGIRPPGTPPALGGSPLVETEEDMPILLWLVGAPVGLILLLLLLGVISF